MDFLDTLARRNRHFAAQCFTAGLKMLPTRRTIIIGCVDPRVDPYQVLGLEAGEAAVIRNMGGRVTPGALDAVALVAALASAAGDSLGPGWNLLLLQHTDCGVVGCFHLAPTLLSRHLGVAQPGLCALALDDPYRAIAIDVAALHANPALPVGIGISGAVYDVATGQVEIIVDARPRARPRFF